MGLLITLALGLFILAGALVSYFAKNKKVVEQLSVAIATGTLTTLAILELLPESLENLEGSSFGFLILAVSILGGIVILKVLDHFVPEHDSHYAHHGHAHEYKEENETHVGIVSAVAVTLHNIIEGMAVYSIAEQSALTGAMVALGVGLHNIPMGMIIYSTIHKKKNRTIMLLLATFSTFCGGILMKLLYGHISELVVGILVALTLGMVIYIVVFELIPMLIHEKKWKITIPGIIIGILIIVGSSFIE